MIIIKNIIIQYRGVNIMRKNIQLRTLILHEAEASVKNILKLLNIVAANIQSNL